MSYPPPTLVPRRSRASWARRLVFVVTLGLLLGTCTISRLLRSGDKADAGANSDDAFAPAATPSDTQAPQISPSVPAPAAAPVKVDAPVDTAAPAPPSVDARQPNRWYYVPQIGDGPGAIYSRTGGGWDFAFACTLANRTIEFIAVNTGDPGTFDKQYMKVDRVKLMMDATYSKEGNGTISTKLPAKHPFFTAFVGVDKSLEVQLQADRKTVLAIGPDVTRVIRECRGEGEAKAAAGAGAKN